MKSDIRCIPCLLRQAIAAMNLCKIDTGRQREILDELHALLQQELDQDTPPAVAGLMYARLHECCQNQDPYQAIKQESTQQVLAHYKTIQNLIEQADDSLRTATELAIAGNIIDYGVKHDVNVEQELQRIMQGVSAKTKHQFDFEMFTQELARAKTILYLGDNVGETVFDQLLLTEIKKLYPDKKIHYAVKAQPIINDALIDDAIAAGIDKLTTIISSGSNAPGTVLSICSPEFLEKFHSADMIISKGQGNFEALWPTERPLFFLFTPKCEVVIQHHKNWEQGDIILYYAD